MARRKKEISARGGLFFGLIWTAFSSLFLFFGAKMVYDGANRAGWPQVPCSISSFEIKDAADQDPPFQPAVRYTYQWQEVSQVGDKVWANQKGEDDYEDLAELNEQYQKGKLTHCFVNPDSPDEAVLIASSSDIWGGLIFAVFGGSFVAIGIGVMLSSRWKKRQETAPISSKKSNNDGAPKAIMIPFFSVFALAGLGILFFVIVPKGKKYNDAQGWIETPAKVVWSRVRSHSSDDGTTYSVDIFYRYQFEGNEYRSNTADLFSGSSSGRSSKQKKVKEHPRGKEITCYVNPAQPWQALLERDLGWSALFALFPLPFIAVGLGGLWWTFRKRTAVRKNKLLRHSSNGLRQNTSPLRHSPTSADVYHSGSHRSIVGDHGRKTFSPGGKRIKSVLGSLMVALFWNGITSVFVTIAVKSWLSGNPEWFLTLFIIPFVLIGLAMIAYTFYQFLALFNPAPKLTLESSGITLNQATKLKWVISSGSLRLTRFRLYLVGEESAEYRRGTNTVTDTQIFHEQLLFETSSPRKAAKGSISITLPANTMTSWSSSHNRIQWKLVIKGDISLWPDINDRYEIDVIAPDLHPHSST